MAQSDYPSPLSAVLTILLALVAYGLYRLLNPLLFHPYRTYLLLRRQGLRGPTFIPLLGELLHFGRYHDKGVYPYDCYTLGRDYHAQYGDVVHFMFGTLNVLLLSDPALVQAAWKTQHGSYHKGDIIKAGGRAFAGERALSHVDEPQHTRYIRMVSSAFHFQQLQWMATIMVDSSEAAIEKALWSATHDGQGGVVDVHKLYMDLALTVMLQSCFGTALDNKSGASATICRSLDQMFKLIFRRSIVLALPALQHLPILGKAELDNNREALMAVIRGLVRDRVEGRSHSKAEAGAADLLDLMLQAVDKETGEHLDEQQICTDAALFVLAGYETTSSLMAWVMRDLAQRPQLWQQCRSEVERVTGGGPLHSHHLAELHLIDACIHESFRLRPPVPTVGLQALEDHWLYATGEPSRPPLFIPKDVCVWADIASLQTSTALWGDNAAEYDEQRWLKGSDSYRKPAHPLAFNGFSVGSRGCLGAQFALMEARIMTAVTVRRCDMQLLPGQCDAPIVHKLTAQPRCGLLANIAPAATAGQ